MWGSVGTVYGGGPSDGIIKSGDVLLRIDGLRIASDGTIDLDGGSVPFTEVVDRKFRGDSVELDILRDGASLQVQVPLSESWPFSLQSSAYDVKPQFVVFGGLVFQPVDQNLMDEYKPSNLRLEYLFDFLWRMGFTASDPS